MLVNLVFLDFSELQNALCKESGHLPWPWSGPAPFLFPPWLGVHTTRSFIHLHRCTSWESRLHPHPWLPLRPKKRTLAPGPREDAHKGSGPAKEGNLLDYLEQVLKRSRLQACMNRRAREFFGSWSEGEENESRSPEAQVQDRTHLT